MRRCTVLFGDLRMFLAVIFGFMNKIYGLDSVISGYLRVYTSVSVMYVDIRLLRELVLAPQHTLLPDRMGGGPRVVVSIAAFHARVRGSVPGLKETKLFLPHPRVKVSIVGSLRDREVACSASDREGSNFESCVWRTVSSQSSHHPQEVLLAQFSLYVHKGGLKPDSFHFYLTVYIPIWTGGYNYKVWFGERYTITTL